MEERIDLDAWKEDGKGLWQHVQEQGELAFAWCNPWFRLLVVGLGILSAAVVCQLLFGRWYISLPIALYSLLSLYNSIKFLVLDRRIGGLYFFYSTDGFGIGGALERIAIPYSAVVMPEVISPSTVNSNYIDLPVPSEHFDAISILKANGENSVWDQRPFKQAIAEIRVADGRLIAKAYPNEFIVHLFSTLHPLLMYLNRGDPNKLDVGDA